MSSSLITAIAGVSTVFGLLSLLAYFYSQIQLQKYTGSIRHAVEGEPLFRADQVIMILAQFRDDKHRLEALKAIAGYDEARAQALLDKVKDDIDLAKLGRLVS